MKRIIEVNQDQTALEALLGETVTIYGFNYIYTGKLTGVNDTFVELTDASVVYETGAYDDKKWKDAQKLPHEWYVMKSGIESYGILDKK
jgi:hypothetical protein